MVNKKFPIGVLQRSRINLDKRLLTLGNIVRRNEAENRERCCGCLGDRFGASRPTLDIGARTTD
jgi:hypothetical protein